MQIGQISHEHPQSDQKGDLHADSMRSTALAPIPEVYSPHTYLAPFLPVSHWDVTYIGQCP